MGACTKWNDGHVHFDIKQETGNRKHRKQDKLVDQAACKRKIINN